MKGKLLLEQYEYSIPVSQHSLAKLELETDRQFAEHLLLIKTSIDFIGGKLKVEGDWQYIVASNRCNNRNSFLYHRERVTIETVIYPSMTLGLNDNSIDVLVFSLEGSIRDESVWSTCSGLLILDNIRGKGGMFSNTWLISIYLYDARFDECEIRIKLPLYFSSRLKNHN